MIIKAGTYRWNDVISIDNSLEAEIPFILSPFVTSAYDPETSENIEITYAFVGTKINFFSYMKYNGSLTMSYKFGSEITEPIQVGSSWFAYSDTTGWSDGIDFEDDTTGQTLVSGNPYKWGQIFTVTADTEVDDTFGTWFKESAGVVIPAGTYRFNETLTVIPTTIQLPYKINFGSHDGWDVFDEIYLANNILQWRNGDGAFRVDAYNYETQAWTYDSRRVIKTDTPQIVSVDFGEWFTETTTMLIKAGTYKWNDVLTTTSDITVDSPFAVETTWEINSGTIVPLGSPLSLSLAGIEIKNVQSGGNDTSFNVIYKNVDGGGATMYTTNLNSHWNAVAKQLELAGFSNTSLVNGFGQVFTVADDTYVPTNFGLWASKNARVYKEESPKRKFTRLYIGKTVASSGGKCFKRLTKAL